MKFTETWLKLEDLFLKEISRRTSQLYSLICDILNNMSREQEVTKVGNTLSLDYRNKNA